MEAAASLEWPHVLDVAVVAYSVQALCVVLGGVAEGLVCCHRSVCQMKVPV